MLGGVLLDQAICHIEHLRQEIPGPGRSWVHWSAML